MRIGIDLGGTKIEGVCISSRGEITVRRRVETPRSEGYDAIIRRIVELVAELERECGEGGSVGIGHPGSESKIDATLKNSNTTCLNGRPFRRDIEHGLGREVRLANDANCFALSEAIDGAGVDKKIVFGVILGTGVGGGVVIDGQLHTGPNDVAGEWGHTPFDPSGPECYCGRQGCTEQFVSGPALEARYARETGTHCSGRAIVEQSRKGGVAREVLHGYLGDLARALSNVVNVLDPDIIVLGGGISAVDELYTDLPERMASAIFNDEWRTPIVRNLHGDSGGVRGAAFLWPARG